MITALDKKTALVLIDLQQGIVAMNTAHPAAGVIANAALLVAAFRKAGLPVVVVNVNPIGSKASMVRATSNTPHKDPAAQQQEMEAAGFFTIVPEILTTPDDIFITKNTWNAFRDTDLHQQLQQRGITGIVLAGIATSIGVESTARTANELGYNLSFAIDAMTDRVLSAHENSLNVIFPRIGETGSTTTLIAMLEQL